MTNYKELIDTLRDLTHGIVRIANGSVLREAADAIETLTTELADEIAAIVGAENLVEHTVDLTADDGLKDYGKIRRKASLLTADLYRRYVEILDKHKIGKWWWLATPHSTARHEDASWVKCVAPSGDIYYVGCDSDFGVRPFCILKSNIFVSK